MSGFLSAGIVGGPDIPDGGVSRWEFEQDYVDSWDGNDGSPIGSPQFDTDSQVGSHALSLNGSDQYVTVPHNSNLEPTELSFGCWFKTSEDGTLQWVMGKDGPRFDISYNLRVRGDVGIMQSALLAQRTGK